MSLYHIALFVHVIGDITLFIAMGTELLILAALRRANDATQIRAVIEFIPVTDRMAVGGALLLLVSGFYMAGTVWGLQTSWIVVALGSILLIIGPLVRFVVEPRTRALVELVKAVQDGSLPSELAERIQDPILSLALNTNLAVGAGIVFLMTTKPAWTGSIVTMIAAVALGAVSALPVWGAGRAAAGRGRKLPHKW